MAKSGSYFGVPNPLNKNLVMLVKSNGFLKMLDLKAPHEPLITLGEGESRRLSKTDDIPLAGDSSPRGDRFYMIWSSGRITEIAWENSELRIKRDLDYRQLGELKTVGSFTNENEGNKRIASKWQLDLRVRSKDDFNLVYYAFQFPTSEGRTQMARVAFPVSEGEPTRAVDEANIPNQLPVLTDAEIPAFATEYLKDLPTNVRDVVAASVVGSSSFVATGSATVYVVLPDGSTKALGRPTCISASGNSNSTRLVTLHEGGFVLQADLVQGKWKWRQLKNAGGAARQIQMSPDGQYYCLQLADDISIHNANTGQPVMRAESAGCAMWHPRGSLVIAYASGLVEQRSSLDSPPRIIGKVSREAPTSMHLFVEPWQEKAPDQWLIVNCGDSLEFLPFDVHTPFNESETPLLSIEMPDDLSTLTCSPTEGLLVTGNRSGAIDLYFASPSFGVCSRLFGLEGHGGSEITSIAFTKDGKTLITADKSNRQFGWLSENPQVIPDAVSR